MKKFLLLFLIISSSPFALHASYFKAEVKRTESALFHGQLFCEGRRGKFSDKEVMRISDNYLAKTFKKSELKLIDKAHWDAANYISGAIKKHKCNLKKIKKNEKEFNKILNFALDILSGDRYLRD
tara:strand:- start:808 stop:1182 length:375 start_codon:yes stop_codon:yes gene_type:complete